MPSKLTGALWIEGNAVGVRFEGALAAQPVALHLDVVGGQLQGGKGAGVNDFDVATPPALGEAVLAGFLGMGLLHNLYRLSVGQPPDHADGGARAWVTTAKHTWGEPTALDGRPARPLWYVMVVDGQPAGEATLWLDRETGLPLMRRVIVRFEGGEMSVVETYTRFVVTPVAPAPVTPVTP